MATISKYAAYHTVITTGYTNPSNAYADDGVYATAAPAKNAEVSAYFGFPAFTTSEIPDGSIINSVTTEFEYHVSTTASIATQYWQTFKGTTGLGTEQSDTSEPLTDVIKTHQVTTGITLTDLRTDDNVRMRLRSVRGNSNTAVTFYIDYVKVTVDYTVPSFVYGSAVLSGIGTLSGIGALIKCGLATLSGVGDLTGIGRLILTGSSTLSGVGSLVATGVKILIGQATLVGEGVLSAIGALIESYTGQVNPAFNLESSYKQEYTYTGQVISVFNLESLYRFIGIYTGQVIPVFNLESLYRFIGIYTYTGQVISVFNLESSYRFIGIYTGQVIPVFNLESSYRFIGIYTYTGQVNPVFNLESSYRFIGIYKQEYTYTGQVIPVFNLESLYLNEVKVQGLFTIENIAESLYAGDFIYSGLARVDIVLESLSGQVFEVYGLIVFEIEIPALVAQGYADLTLGRLYLMALYSAEIYEVIYLESLTKERLELMSLIDYEEDEIKEFC